MQEEVKRQVVEAMRAQNEHLERLQRENEILRAMQMPPPGLSQGRLHQEQMMNEGDRALGQALPQGDRALGQALPQGDRALEQALPQGDRALGQALPQGDRALGQALPQGDRALGQELPQGDRALGLALPQGDRALGPALPQGDRALGQYGVSQDEDLPGQHEARPGGVRFEEMLETEILLKEFILFEGCFREMRLGRLRRWFHRYNRRLRDLQGGTTEQGQHEPEAIAEKGGRRRFQRLLNLRLVLEHRHPLLQAHWKPWVAGNGANSAGVA